MQMHVRIEMQLLFTSVPGLAYTYQGHSDNCKSRGLPLRRRFRRVVLLAVGPRFWPVWSCLRRWGRMDGSWGMTASWESHATFVWFLPFVVVCWFIVRLECLWKCCCPMHFSCLGIHPFPHFVCRLALVAMALEETIPWSILHPTTVRNHAYSSVQVVCVFWNFHACINVGNLRRARPVIL